MKKLFTISYYTVIESIRNKIFCVILLFALLIMASSIIFSQISGEVPGRIIINVGIGAIELFALLIAIFGAVRLVIQEIENKSIHVVLSKPLKRSIYLLGKYIGIAGVILLNILIMFGGLLMLVFIKGGEFAFGPLILAIVFIFFKMLIVISIGLFFSLVTTSSISSISVTFLIWILGHIANDIKFLSDKMTTPLSKFLMKGVYYIVPNFQYFNFKDYLESASFLSGTNIFLILIYGVGYYTILICFSVLLFSRREF